MMVMQFPVHFSIHPHLNISIRVGNQEHITRGLPAHLKAFPVREICWRFHSVHDVHGCGFGSETIPMVFKKLSHEATPQPPGQAMSSQEASKIRFRGSAPGYHPADVEAFHEDVVSSLQWWEQQAHALAGRESQLLQEIDTLGAKVQALSIQLEMLRVTGDVVIDPATGQPVTIPAGGGFSPTPPSTAPSATTPPGPVPPSTPPTPPSPNQVTPPTAPTVPGFPGFAPDSSYNG